MHMLHSKVYLIFYQPLWESSSFFLSGCSPWSRSRSRSKTPATASCAVCGSARSILVNQVNDNLAPFPFGSLPPGHVSIRTFHFNARLYKSSATSDTFLWNSHSADASMLAAQQWQSAMLKRTVFVHAVKKGLNSGRSEKFDPARTIQGCR